MENWKKKVLEYLRGPAPESVAGLDAAAAAPPLLREALARRGRSLLVIAPDLPTAEHLAAETDALNAELGCGLSIRHMPETVRGRMIVSGGESRRARMLAESLESPPDIIVGSVHALLAPVPPPEQTSRASFTLRVGERCPMRDLLARLTELDYDDELEVSVPGEFSRRGGIVDVFSPAHPNPCRLEFFGDDIDSMRLFSTETQRSAGVIDSYRVIAPHPSSDALRQTENRCDFFDYWRPESCRVVLMHPAECGERLERYGNGQETVRRLLDVRERAESNGNLTVFFSAAGDSGVRAAVPAGCAPPLENLSGELPQELRFGALEPMRKLLFVQLRQWLEDGYSVCIAAPDAEKLERLTQWCESRGLRHRELRLIRADIGCGYLLRQQKLVILTEQELFTANVFRRQEAAPDHQLRTDATGPDSAHGDPPGSDPGERRIMTELNEGDYAVHLLHGVCIFRGIVETDKQGVAREAMKLEFRDGALLYVPLNQADQVSRYLGAPGKVRLHQLGGSRWSSEKKAAGKAVRAYAADMLRLQAAREASPGIAFPADTLDSRLFESAFPYADTPDQKRSAGEIKADMERPRPMDRLLCGDVGYGKTELAMRAAFKAVSAGFQVAVLAPTTVLAQQHFFSFRERFAESAFVIELLSRFQTRQEQASILERLRTGGVDIVIGTHRLCNRMVKFRNLGLIVIDEEQRFGVKQKESLRRMRTEVDVLTMSATPIPRTLYLAMAGARDLSTLQTAPKFRLPVKTIVAPQEDTVAADAIRSELQRGGQVYYLHNRVKTIGRRRDQLAALLPDIRFGIAHGQLPEAELSRTMTAFLEGEIDCLICSTIVESGLDIPNANTIIIERADRFGLAQLYQLRGRVGRRSRQSYAYLLLPPEQLISSDARKRIAAIRRCSQLGAGFQLALKDLEIRGSGNILGAEQSGHLNVIGFDLYCRLLKSEVASLLGRKSDFLPTAEVAIDFLVYGFRAPDGLLAAGIPPDYIPGTGQRLAAYRRLSAAASGEALDDFRTELQDRYGRPPESVENLLKWRQLSILVSLAGYDSLTVADGRVILQNSRGIYRDRGLVPTVDSSSPPALRLAMLRDLLRRLRGE